MKPAAVMTAALLAGGLIGCGHRDVSPAPAIRTMPRRTVVWVGAAGADLMTVSELKRAGVDELAVHRGKVELGKGIPVLRTVPAPPLAEGLPTAAVLTLIPELDEVDPAAADAVWRALARDLEAGIPPVELLVEMPRTADRLDEFVSRLANVSGLPVIPVLATSQLVDSRAVAVARRAGNCLVIALGQTSAWRKDARPVVGGLRDALAPLAAAGAGVRVGLVVAPESQPPLQGWGEDLNPLSEPANAEILPSSTLERSFRMRRSLTWSGREWQTGQTVALSWTDAAELDAALGEAARLTVPVPLGWDVLWLPPADATPLGLSRDALLAYLDGEGPAPSLSVSLERSGSSLRVVVENSSPFPSALSRYANWVEVDARDTALVAEDRGDFDGIVLGNTRSGEFKRTSGSGVTAVRLLENYVAPGEKLRSGRIRLAGRRVVPAVRWHLQLSDGREVSGTVR